MPQAGAAGSGQLRPTGYQPPVRTDGERLAAAGHAPPAASVGPCGFHRVSTASADANVIRRPLDLALGAWVWPRSRASS